MSERKHEFTVDEFGAMIRDAAELDMVSDYCKDPAALARRLEQEAQRRQREGIPMPEMPDVGPGPFAGCKTPEQVVDELGPRFPGRILLRCQMPQARGALRILARQELESALWLHKALAAVRLSRWVEHRLCGPIPLPADHRRVFLLLVADLLREIRESDAIRTVGIRTPAHTTLAQIAGETSLETIASQDSEAGLGLARASRKLDALSKDPDLSEILLLRCYTGLTAEEVADVIQRPVTVVEHKFAVASDWVMSQAA